MGERLSYQDATRGGRVIPGARDCAGRYEAISRALRDARGFTVLDFGANDGYFSRRLAEDFDASVTAVDDWKSLPRSVAHEPRVSVIARRLSPHDVRHLGEFDVVLALSVLHHVPEWGEMLQALHDAARHVLFVETPDVSETLPKAVSHCPELAYTVGALGGETIAQTPGYRSQILRPLKAVYK
jgi:2-polyprenyl-3-methyl-5-hydroxy-6-metoxy-1,4-benzoquinol methylase